MGALQCHSQRISNCLTKGSHELFKWIFICIMLWPIRWRKSIKSEMWLIYWPSSERVDTIHILYSIDHWQFYTSKTWRSRYGSQLFHLLSILLYWIVYQLSIDFIQFKLCFMQNTFFVIFSNVFDFCFVNDPDEQYEYFFFLCISDSHLDFHFYSEHLIPLYRNVFM